MRPRNCDHFRGGIDAGDLGPQPRQRLAQQSRAAADIEHRLADERRAAALVALPMLVDLIADIFQTHWIELVEHGFRPFGVPPALGLAGELRDLFGYDACLAHARLLTVRDL